MNNKPKNLIKDNHPKTEINPPQTYEEPDCMLNWSTKVLVYRDVPQRNNILHLFNSVIFHINDKRITFAPKFTVPLLHLLRY